MQGVTVVNFGITLAVDK